MTTLTVRARSSPVVALPVDPPPRFGESQELTFTTPGADDVVSIGTVEFTAHDHRLEVRVTGNQHLSGHVGLLEIGLNGRVVGEIEIVPDKISEDRFVALRGDLERLWSGLVFDPQGLGHLSAGLPPPEELLRRIDHAVRSILEAPHEVLVAASAVRTLQNARRAHELTPSLLRRAESGLPALTRTVVRSTANSANAAVATTLRSLARYAIRRADNATATRCRVYLSTPLFSGLQSVRVDQTWVMRSDPRYRQVHAVSRLLDRPELGATEGPGELRLGVAALSRLYEYWTFLKVLDAARARYGAPTGSGFEGLAVRTTRGARLEIPAGATVTFPGDVHVAFEPSINQAGSSWMDLEYAGPVPTAGSRHQGRITPDIVVYRQDPIGGVAMVYDAKYAGRAMIEQDAAELHRKYARIRHRGVPVVRNVIALHPHIGYSNQWSGYGHAGLAPLGPAVDLPLPETRSGDRVHVSEPATVPTSDRCYEGVAVVIDQYSTRLILGDRRVRLDLVAHELAAPSPLLSTTVVLPDIPELQGLAQAMRIAKMTIVHQADTSAAARRRALSEVVTQLPFSHRPVVVTLDTELQANILRIRPDTVFTSQI